MPYIVYTTVWSEGEVVAHTSDELFPVGYDPYGDLYYTDYQTLIKYPSYRKLAEFDNHDYAIQFDTSYYPRRPKK